MLGGGKMPKGSAKLTENRKEEIIDACAKLYETMNYNEVTIKEISKETSFSRPSIYNYFESKEEIFLAILTKEYNAWADDLEQLSLVGSRQSINEYADCFAKTVAKRKQLLKIQAMNLYEIEEGSRFERLVEYKQAFFRATSAFEQSLKASLLELSEEKIEHFRYAFFPFMYGIYPYAYPTDKQMAAMDQVGLPYQKSSIYGLCFQFAREFLN